MVYNQLARILGDEERYVMTPTFTVVKVEGIVAHGDLGHVQVGEGREARGEGVAVAAGWSGRWRPRPARGTSAGPRSPR